MQVKHDCTDAKQVISESALIPYQAVHSLGSGASLVLAPHPDDEVFGCAGAIMRQVAAGYAVTVIILTDGGGFETDAAKRAAYVAQRRQESRAAAALLGYGEPLFWEYPDRELPYDEAVVRRISDVLAHTNARWLYAPSPYELHPDHRQLSLAALEVVRRIGSPLSLVFYEISAPLPPNRLLDISDLFERKRQAIQCFTSQLAVRAYERHVAALNRYRTYTLPESVQAAEGYWVLDAAAVLHMQHEPYLAIAKQWRMQSALPLADVPLVSVMIRTMGRAELAEAITSVALQTYPRIEIVVVDARGTGQLQIEQLQQRFPLRIVNADTQMHLNRGAAANLGLESARGEYLIFLDDDDWFLPEHIAGLIDALLSNPHLRVAYGATECIQRNTSGAWELTYTFNQPFDRIRLLIENYIPMHAALFHRSILQAGCRIDESFDIYEDWDFWIQLANCTEFIFVNRVGAIYRLGQNSGFGLTGSSASIERGLQALFSKWRTLWSDEQVTAIANYAKYRSMYHELRELFDNQQQQLIAAQADLQSALVRERETLAREQILRNENAILSETSAATHQLVDEQQTAISNQDKVIENQSRDIKRLSDQLFNMESSTSWKITAPMRAAVIQGRRIAHTGRVAFYFTKQNLQLTWQIWHAQGMRAVFVRGARKLARLLRRNANTELPVRDWRLEQQIHPLAFPVVTSPLVSIIIPVHNQPSYTFSCLQALLEYSAAHIATEIIVVDDHSAHETMQMLGQISGIRTLRNPGARGFVNACNFGATHAQGAYLVFLNNDTLVSADWLEELLAVFSRFPDAGLVGARLVYPDGRLQAAGGVVWRDGSAAHVGWGQAANAPEYSYVRKVDYCPGACIAVPRSLFDALGQFSSAFAPAYYEDADLAFKVRAAGREVYYQPAAVIYHAEGVSMGKNTLADFKSFQTLNRQRFHSRWYEALLKQPVNHGDARLARDREVRKSILVLDKVMLTPDHDAGSLRMLRLLEELVGLGVKVVFATLYLDDREPYRSQLQQSGVEVLYSPYENTVHSYLERCGRQFDAVLLSRADVAEQLMDTVAKLAPQALRIFDTVDLHYLREERLAALEESAALARAAAARKQTELSLMSKAHVTLVVSPFEQAVLKQEDASLRIEVVSTIHDVHGSAADYAEREGLLFIGSFNHPPNVDAMLYYVREILPRIHQALGAVPTWIIGSDPPAEIKALAAETVIVEGFVPDLTAHFARARLSIAPLRYGAGVKGKINTSMAYGVPVIATPVAVEGMALTDKVDVMVGADAATFVEALVAVYQNPQLWQQLSTNGMRNLQQHFSRASARRTMADLLQCAE